MGAISRLHICGDTTHLLDLMPLSGADIIDIDWMVDMHAAQMAFGPEVSVCGNLDAMNVMLKGSPAQVREAALRCLEQGGERSFSAAGCEILVGTPLANLQAHAAALRELSTNNANRWLPNGRVGSD
jgi:uroporphyrinogen decarboxylase